MNYKCFFLFIIFICNIAQAQTKLDTLYGIWEDDSKSDTIRANALADYILDGFFRTQPDSAVILLNQLFQFSERVDYKIGMVDALVTLGYTHFRMGNYPKALATYERGLEIAEEIGDKQGKADILLRTGFIYHDNGDIVTALNYYQRSQKLFEEINNLSGISSVYNELGSIYRTEDEYAKSLDYYLKSLAISKKLDGEYASPSVQLNIGRLYLQQDDFINAFNYFEKGLEIYEKMGDKLGIASGLAGIGNVYFEQAKYEQSLKYHTKSLAISEEIDDIQGYISSSLAIGEIFEIRGNFSMTIELCEKSLELAITLGDLDDQEASCECLYRAYKATGNISKALTYHEQMILFTDSLKTEETVKKLQNMEFAKTRLADSLVQVERTLKVEMDHRDEVRENEKNRNIAIVLGIFFLFLAGGFFSRWRYVRKSKAIIEKEKDRSESLLLNILPAEIAEELKEKGSADARDFDMVSILFSDFENFTQASEKLTAKELIDEINHCFKAFDHICEKYGVEKIKTIGDAYMAAGGLPVPTGESTKNTVLAALEMQSFIIHRKEQKRVLDELPFVMRLGIHTGPVVAGIVGVKKFQYDIWGDTVNTASRMESSGEVNKVNISQYTYELIKDDPQFVFEGRGKIQAKGKGEIEMYFVEKIE